MALSACAPPPRAETGQENAPADIAELWQEPSDLPTRDLFLGPGGAALAPPVNDGQFQFFSFKTNGTNPGYEVRDASGRMWSVKLGIEAQPEVTASRILWAIGFHQPPQYLVRRFTLVGGDGGVKTTARFRTEPERWTSVAEWSWYANPFLDSGPFHGLVIAQQILNNWDLKTSNNRIYEAADPGVVPHRRFMVRDVGASLGKAKQFPVFTMLGTPGAQGTKNDIDDFEGQGFITGVIGDKPTFDYRGFNQSLLDRVTVADVIWVCDLLGRVTDDQWRAAFDAGAYPQDEAARYIKKIKQKIAQGLALKGSTR
jgi:hypothetical protein